MMDKAEIEESIEAYKPFRHTIAMIRIRCRALMDALSAVFWAWCIRFTPQPAGHHHYFGTRGGFGYAERVVPPLFKISPFFSRAG